MKKRITTIVRIAFGVMLLSIAVIGLSGAMTPAQYPEPAQKFMTALQNTQYMMLLVILLKLALGISLLINRFVPLALVVFAPVALNMVLFHVFLDVKGIVPALFIGALNLYLLIANIKAYRPLLAAKHVRENRPPESVRMQ
jgi:putative oxidoreductase